MTQRSAAAIPFIQETNIRTPSRRTMERAYLNSDTSYDGVFFLGVKTTGIFCRPSCRVRKPRPENVEFFATAKEATFGGYRPCKRCHPLEDVGTPPPWLGPLLSTIDQKPTARYPDAFLRSRHIDPSRVRRFFLKNYGMTFQAYCRGRRLGESLEQIRTGASLDDVALGYGYTSHSGFRDAFSKTFGSAPGRSRGKNLILTAWIESPFGPLIAAATPDGICLLEFTDRRMLDRQFKRLRGYFHCAIVPGMNSHIRQLKSELSEYFKGRRKTFSISLVVPASPFEKKVWDALQNIPYGSTASYEDIAVTIGVPHASRAVGRANGMNRVAIIIPCHRVINKNGAMGGYGGGIWRKKMLLALEAAH
jgi:AraC family transcriptional regulator, regulatory protein of adaptative response / methylated-DNA-[protein]-cysteine methyltransferase